jgi:glutamate N-acetyltransferase/amino-acid N-acetyltransferase
MTVAIPEGYRFAGVTCGIKADRTKRDLSLLVSDREAAAAGVFTTNRVCAAPVQCCRKRLPSSRVRGIVVNSGNANACTGEQGVTDAERMASELARRLGGSPEQALVCSTGIIGHPLPMEKVAAGIGAAVDLLGSDAERLQAAAEGILTTDTRTKVAGRSVQTPAGAARVLGIAKGAAMIGPNMATMLAFVLTDAQASPEVLDQTLRAAVDRSFHCISVEGHTSTNDTVLLLANGAGGLKAPGGSASPFTEAVGEVCEELAQAIVEDAEGMTHRITIDVSGTRTDADARRIAKTVADSALVKTAVFGADPNWGRICSAAGYAGVASTGRCCTNGGRRPSSTRRSSPSGCGRIAKRISSCS